MKNRALVLVAASAIALAACSEATPDDATADAAMEAASDSSAASMTGEPPASLPASLPQIAYDYGLAFALPAQEVGNLMRRHATICEQQGPA